MAHSPRGSNRGPAAAAENRRALLGAARQLFADQGCDVPLSTVAREAGVGQAVLYRHFPTRLDLALAVFEENFVELEQVAAAPGADAFHQLFARLVDLILESFGFVEVAVGAHVAEYDGDQRLAALMAGPLERARVAGRVSRDVTVADIALGIRMLYGVAATAPDAAQRRTDVLRVKGLIAARLVP